MDLITISKVCVTHFTLVSVPKALYVNTEKQHLHTAHYGLIMYDGLPHNVKTRTVIYAKKKKNTYVNLCMVPQEPYGII